jgi:hypothetical protein
VGDDDGRRIFEQHAEELGCFYDAHAGWLFGHAYLRTQRDRQLAAARLKPGGLTCGLPDVCEAGLTRVHLYRSGTHGKLTGEPAGQIMRRRPVTFVAGPDLYQ